MLSCHRPAFSATLSRAVPSSFRQHRSRLRRNPLLLPLRLQPLSLLVAVGAPLWPPPLPRRGSSLPPCGVVEPVTDRTPSPSRPPPDPAASASARGPETGDPEMEGTTRREMVTAPLPPPEEGRVENPLFRFVFVPPLAQQPAVPKTSIKEQFPQSLGLKRRRMVYRASRDHFPPPLSPGRGGGVAQEHPSCPFVEPGKGSSTQAPATSRHTQAGLLRFLPHEEESGECYTTHPDPAACHHRPGLHRPRAGSLCSTSLPHHGYVGGSVGAAGTVSRSLASAPQSVSVAPTDHQTRLCDSVRPASPQVQGHPVHFSQTRRCSCLACGNRSPTGEGRDRAGPSSRYEVGVVQPLLHCAQERWWVTTDLGSASFEPCTSQAAVQDVDAETHFWMRPSPRLVCSDRPEGRVLSCLDPPATQAIPAFRVRGTGVSVQGPALWAVPVASRLHQSRGGGPCPLREQGVRILNYLDDWLILAQSRIQLSAHRDLVLKHLSLLGLRVNWEKSKLVPTQRISFLGMQFDSVNQTACLTQERAQSVLNCFKTLSGRTAVPLKLFQRLLGHMAAAAVTVPLGLLHMRPLQHWLYGRIPRWAWKRGTYRVQITPACRKTFRPWSDPSFLRAGVPLEQVSRHAVVFTDASTTGWGATYNGHAVSGVWTGPQLHWHINCLELLAVRLALSRLRGCLQRKDVLVRTDNTATVAYINRQGGLRSRRMSQLARHLLLWSQKHLRSLRAIHIPGVFNRAADELSRAALPGEWRLHPQAVQLIWGRFGAAQVDLFASPETTHCQEFYSLTEATLGTDALAHSWPRGLRKYAFPPVSLLAQTLCKIREDEEQVLLVAPYWPNRTWFPELMLLATAPPWPIPLRKDLLSQRRGTLWHPRSDLWKLHEWSLDGTRRF